MVVRLLGSFFFFVILLWRIAEHTSLIVIIDTYSNFCLFVSKSLRNLIYLCIWAKASTNEKLMCNCLSKSKKHLTCSSIWSFLNLEGYSRRNTYSLTGGDSSFSLLGLEPLSCINSSRPSIVGFLFLIGGVSFLILTCLPLLGVIALRCYMGLDSTLLGKLSWVRPNSNNNMLHLIL